MTAPTALTVPTLLTAPSLVAHGIAYGGGALDPDPTKTTVTLDTTGATLILVSFAADALQGDLPPFADSAGNTWQHLTTALGRPYFPFTSGTASFYWVATPTTSPTHAFTATCIFGSAHAVMQVMAWRDMVLPAWSDQIWAGTGLLTLTLGPVAALGFAVAVACAGMEPTATGTLTLSTPGWTAMDSLPATTFAADHGHCGMTVAYRFFDPLTSGVTNDWVNTATGNYFGAGIFQFTFTGPTPPPIATYAIRRLRRFALPWDDAHRQKTLSRLELIAQPGIGDLVTTDPVVMLRLSRDGGRTWGNEHHLHPGPMGESLRRLSVTRLGRARNPVVELTTTDPVASSWVELLVDLSEGTS